MTVEERLEYCKAWDEIRRLKNELKQTRWIPVSERLPTDDQYSVIGFDVLWGDVCNVIKIKNGWHKVISGKELHNDRITHWMPLPEPPRE
jgi:hypothetical protein